METRDKVAARQKRIFVICPVRGATEDERRLIEGYVAEREREGCSVHYPPRDTNQVDPVGTSICRQNRQAIMDADEVHVYWNSASQGSLFDLGMVFMLGKPVVLINPEAIKALTTPGKKSFPNVLVDLGMLRR